MAVPAIVRHSPLRSRRDLNHDNPCHDMSGQQLRRMYERFPGMCLCRVSSAFVVVAWEYGVTYFLCTLKRRGGEYWRADAGVAEVETSKRICHIFSFSFFFSFCIDFLCLTLYKCQFLGRPC